MTHTLDGTYVSAKPPSAWITHSPRTERHSLDVQVTTLAEKPQYGKSSVKAARRFAASTTRSYGSQPRSAARPRNEMPTIARMVEKALSDTKTADFRTIGSLSKQLGVPREHVQMGLNVLGDKVRRPWGAEDRFPDAFRLTKDGYTWREKLWRFRASAGRTSR